MYVCVCVYVCIYICMCVYVCMYVCVCMYIYVCVYIYIYIYIYLSHIFFTHSPIDGHLGCFYVFATVNSAAMDTEVHIPFLISIIVFFK